MQKKRLKWFIFSTIQLTITTNLQIQSKKIQINSVENNGCYHLKSKSYYIQRQTNVATHTVSNTPS